ncbi:hypothetical protein ACFV5N_00210 [Streptomyces sp. NPDC059853]|uniref:hypothetical protein n=1 Tax=Streptomyces sp. NPDC059853 TaxID=3346973 RepID=UPI003653C3F9
MTGRTATGYDGAEASRDILARICAELTDIRALTAAAGVGIAGEAERIIGALRDGADVAAAEEDLHQLLRRSGVAGGLRGVTRGGGIGGMPPLPGHPVPPPVLVCPLSRCPRAVLADDPLEMSRECALHGLRLRRIDPPG